MVRDRLLEMQKISDGASNQPTVSVRPDATQPLLGDSTEEDFQSFMSKVEGVRKTLNKMSELQSKILKNQDEIIHTPGVETELTRVLNNDVEMFLKLGREVRSIITLLTDETKDLNNVGFNRAKREQVRGVIRLLEVSMASFNREQEAYKSKAAKNISDYLKIRDITASAEEIEEAINEGNISEFTKGVILSHHDKMALYEDVKARTHDLKKLENQIRELADLFHDVHILVVAQGEMMDNIELNVANAAQYANQALKNVDDAQRLKKRSRKMLIICIIVIIVIVLVLLLVGNIACKLHPLC